MNTGYQNMEPYSNRFKIQGQEETETVQFTDKFGGYKKCWSTSKLTICKLKVCEIKN